MERNFKICVECNNFLNEIYQFVAKTKLIDAMFMEIEQVEYQQQQPDVPELQDQILQVPQSHPQPQDCAIAAPEPKEHEYESHINSVRHKFGLKPLEMTAETLNNLFDESNITGALEIKLESDLGDFEAHDTLSDDQDFSESSEEEEDESEIEQLSDSQLRKHEESHQYQNESSESEHEERKKLKKKYRKSDEEKLFE